MSRGFSNHLCLPWTPRRLVRDEIRPQRTEPTSRLANRDAGTTAADEALFYRARLVLATPSPPPALKSRRSHQLPDGKKCERRQGGTLCWLWGPVSSPRFPRLRVGLDRQVPAFQRDVTSLAPAVLDRTV